jgi:hypothetical protein
LVADANNGIEFLSRRLEGVSNGKIGVFGNSLGAVVGINLATGNPKVRSVVASNTPTRVADFALTTFRRTLLMCMKVLDAFIPFRLSVNHFIPYYQILRSKQTIEQVRCGPLIADARRLAR